VRAVSGDEILDEVTLDLMLMSLVGSMASDGDPAGFAGGTKQESVLIGVLGW
jgi:hypothetical protein